MENETIRKTEIWVNVEDKAVMQRKEDEICLIKVKKTAKDSVFRDLFENPTYLLQLYQTLHPEDTEVMEE